MQRLIRQSFNFEKQKYTFTIDTDGVFLFLKCYKGSSEKNETIPLQRFSPIEKRIMSIIWDSIGSTLSNDLRSDTKKMSAYVRRHFKVSFPEHEELATLDEKLINNGFVEYNDDLVLDYLEYKEMPFVSFEYEGKKFAYTSNDKLNEFQEGLMKEVAKKQSEIKQIHDLDTDIFYKKQRAFGKESRNVL